jgi:7-carboxy-7-deazaguanine synthase (Cx14CxxC type)
VHDQPRRRPARSYAVKEIFKTLQGEGARSGRAAVFCRFAGCNLWSGREADRANAICRFCDTDFVGTDGGGGGRFAGAEALADAVEAEWGKRGPGRYVVLTGGEPLLQVDGALVDALHARGFEIGLETNGTLLPPSGIDWICVSPKAGAELVLTAGDELKLVYPQEQARPERFEHLAFEHFFLQPMDSPQAGANLAAAIRFCTDNPRWRLSLQSHKMIGIR